MGPLQPEEVLSAWSGRAGKEPRMEEMPTKKR